MEDLRKVSGVSALLTVLDVMQKPALQQPRKLQHLQLQHLLSARQSGTEIYFYHTLSVNCMLSSSGSDPNKPCVFPFIYMDETYNSCTTIDSNREVFFFM